MEYRSLNFDPKTLHYHGIIGTGGIGSGKFFVLNGDHTLGREESRSGHFLNINDYCKQHIILHYIKVLLGSSFTVIPIGKIGDDEAGHILFREMLGTGFVMDRVETVPEASTLFSFCFYYPDGSGGNLTTDNSASSRVDPVFIEKASDDINKLGPKGIILAAPEVPLSARKKLLELGKQNGLFCSASFTSGEIQDVLNDRTIENVDLIAINIDEALAVADTVIDETDTISIVSTAVNILKSINKNIMVSITAGKNGSWCWNGNHLENFPAISTSAVSTAGAGDAFFSGLLCGLILGLELFEAQELATLVAGLSITSPDTIHKGVDRNSLFRFLKTSGLTFSDKLIKIMED
jgi:ribokinase